MPSLATLQAYAERCAAKLGIADAVVLRWADRPCTCKRGVNAHCHIMDSKMPRGTICITRGNWRLKTVKGWHYLMAHEVSHLATKSSHSSPTFARRMETLGVANLRERDLLRAVRKHRHAWSIHTQGQDICAIYGKRRKG